MRGAEALERKQLNSTVATGVRTQMEHLIDVAESMGLLALSVLLGAVIGLERERQGKSAGLHARAGLLGSALFTLISIRGSAAWQPWGATLQGWLRRSLPE